MYVQTELIKREVEREKRDREFWIAAFGGESSRDLPEPENEEQAIARSPLGQR